MMNAAWSRREVGLTYWADTRVVAIEACQPSKMVPFGAMRAKPSGSYDLAADRACDEGGGRSLWVRRCAQHT